MTRVAVVVMDSLRVDAFQDHFDWLPGTHFENAWSTSHWTVPAHGSLFTGLYPSEYGMTDAKSPHFSYPDPLSVQLNETGVVTRAYSANAYISPKFGYSRGFNTFTGNFRMKRLLDDVVDWNTIIGETSPGIERYVRSFWECLRSPRPFESLRQGILLKAEEEGWWQPKDSGITCAIEWAKTLPNEADDEFVFFNLMEAHTPYLELPDEYLAGFNRDEIPSHPNLEQVFNSTEDGERVREAYDLAVKYLANRYRELFEILQQKVDYVVTLGDHGEMLGEHDIWGHNYGLFEELTHIPLVVSDGSGSIEADDRLVSLVDVPATVRGLLNLDSREDRGHSLLDPAYPGRDCCLLESQGLPKELLTRLDEQYDVDEYDISLRGIVTEDGVGYETKDGWYQETEADVNLHERLEEEFEDLEVRESSPTEIDEGTRRHLKDLGYA